MFNGSRFFISATLIAALFVSLFIFSVPRTTRACLVIPRPMTLLGLYLKSDLIVAAAIKSDKIERIIEDEKEYGTVEVNRNLRVFSVLKGATPSDLVYTKTEYRRKNVEPEESAEEESDGYRPYGYRGVDQLRVGERYLWFFTKDAETGEYELTDDTSGVKKLDDFELGVLQKRIREIKSILKMEKKLQAAATAEWLIRCVEEPATRWDGVFELNDSFSALEYESETEEKNEEPEIVEKTKTPAPPEEIKSGSPRYAESLTDSQKTYLSSILFSLIGPDMFAENAQNNNLYQFTVLVGRWDKSRLAMYSFGILESVDAADAVKTRAVMDYLATILEDDELSEITAQFSAADGSDEAETEEPDETDAAEDTEPQSVETVAATEAEQEILNPVESAPETTATETPAEKLTPAELRVKIRADFISRYEYLAARSFQPDQPEEVARNERPR